MKEAVKRLEHLSYMYERLMDEVREISGMASVAVEVYSKERLLGFFDEVLQTVLICSTITEGTYREIDNKIIKNLCHYGDALVAYNEINEKGDKIDWDSFLSDMQSLNIGQKTLISAKLASVAYERGYTLAKPFAIASCGFYKNFYSVIKRRTKWVIIAFVNATTSQKDKEARQAKIKMGIDMLEAVFLKSWRELTDVARDKNKENVDYDKMVVAFFEYIERIEDEAEERGEELDPALDLSFEEFKKKWQKGE